MSDQPPSTILADDIPEAPPLHATATPVGDQTAPPARRTGAASARVVTPLPADAEHAEKVKAAFEFQPVWSRYNRDTQEWEDYALKPFSLYRRQIWWRLLANMVPLPAQGYGRYTTATAFDGWAALYLCSHDPQQFAVLLPNPAKFAEVISDWAANEIPEDLWVEATNLAWRMDEAAELTAVRLPQRPSPHREVGK